MFVTSLTYTNHLTGYVMTANSNAAPSVDHQPTFNEIPGTSNQCHSMKISSNIDYFSCVELVFPERLFMKFIKCSFAVPFLVGVLTIMPAAAFAHGGGGGGGGGHGFGGGGGGHTFGGSSGHGFSHGFGGTRGFSNGRFSGRGDHGHFGDHDFHRRDRDFRDRRFRDFDGDFFDFGFSGFGYPYYYQYDYPYYYPYAYYNYDTYLSGYKYGDYRISRSGPVTSYVQSALGKRGYYRGPIDGVIGFSSRRAIRNFQTDQGLPVTGSIDRKLLSVLRIG
jgi:hypothetical protein